MAEPDADITVSVRIRGRVQGVWYRGWTEERGGAPRPARVGAQPPRRQRGGAVLRTRRRSSSDMIDACWKGPSAARVEAVEQVSGGRIHGFGLRHAHDRMTDACLSRYLGSRRQLSALSCGACRCRRTDHTCRAAAGARCVRRGYDGAGCQGSRRRGAGRHRGTEGLAPGVSGLRRQEDQLPQFRRTAAEEPAARRRPAARQCPGRRLQCDLRSLSNADRRGRSRSRHVTARVPICAPDRYVHCAGRSRSRHSIRRMPARSSTPTRRNASAAAGTGTRTHAAPSARGRRGPC